MGFPTVNSMANPYHSDSADFECVHHSTASGQEDAPIFSNPTIWSCADLERIRHSALEEPFIFLYR